MLCKINLQNADIYSCNTFARCWQFSPAEIMQRMFVGMNLKFHKEVLGVYF